MKKFGLVGYPLGHSFSKGYFSQKFVNENITDCEYQNYPLENIKEFIPLLEKEKEIIGLNVTIPYKEKVIPFLDDIDDEAKEIGAVNTIQIKRSGNEIIAKGYNTDSFGFEQPLVKVIQDHHKKALILGTGGASKAVAYILKKHNICYLWVSRTPRDQQMISYADLSSHLLADYKIIINTSPIGMHPNEDSFPDIPYKGITNEHILYDLVYNPLKTTFLKKGEEKGATIINGLPMLHLQAEKSWQIWNC